MNESLKNKAGRKPKQDRSIYRYTVNLTASENAKFLSLYRQSDMRGKSRFISSIIFGRTMRVVRIDKSTADFFMRLTNIYSQYQSIGVNYNQIVKALKSNFSEKRAFVLLRQLEKATCDLSELSKKVLEITKEFEQKHLNIIDK